MSIKVDKKTSQVQLSNLFQEYYKQQREEYRKELTGFLDDVMQNIQQFKLYTIRTKQGYSFIMLKDLYEYFISKNPNTQLRRNKFTSALQTMLNEDQQIVLKMIDKHQQRGLLLKV